MKSVVLFVCTGNSCRSPMAAGYLKKILGKRDDIEIHSAGTAAFEDQKASEAAIKVMQEVGVDLSQHRSKKLMPEMVERATFVLTMTKYHRMQILQMCPNAAGKVFLLKEFDERIEENFLDIPDPMGHPVEDYQLCFEKMRPPIEHIAKNILKPKKD